MMPPGRCASLLTLLSAKGGAASTV
jgi:transposase InsO family protein